MTEPRIDKQAMRIAYEDLGLTLDKIADTFMCSPSTVRSFAWASNWKRPGDPNDDGDGDDYAAPRTDDPLGDALAAAGYERRVHTEPCTDRPIFNWGLS